MRLKLSGKLGSRWPRVIQLVTISPQGAESPLAWFLQYIKPWSCPTHSWCTLESNFLLKIGISSSTLTCKASINSPFSQNNSILKNPKMEMIFKISLQFQIIVWNCLLEKYCRKNWFLWFCVFSLHILNYLFWPLPPCHLPDEWKMSKNANTTHSRILQRNSRVSLHVKSSVL